jgi:hypothetical protein
VLVAVARGRKVCAEVGEARRQRGEPRDEELALVGHRRKYLHGSTVVRLSKLATSLANIKRTCAPCGRWGEGLLLKA